MLSIVSLAKAKHCKEMEKASFDTKAMYFLMGLLCLAVLCPQRRATHGQNGDLGSPTVFFFPLFFSKSFFDMKAHLNTQPSFMSRLALRIDSWYLIFELWKPHYNLELPNHRHGVGERDPSLSGSCRHPSQEEAQASGWGRFPWSSQKFAKQALRWDSGFGFIVRLQQSWKAELTEEPWGARPVTKLPGQSQGPLVLTAWVSVLSKEGLTGWDNSPVFIFEKGYSISRIIPSSLLLG